MKKLLYIPICLLGVSYNADAQDNISNQFNRLQQLGDTILTGSNDEARRIANEQFTAVLRSVLSDKRSFGMPFDSVKNVSALSSSDGRIRIYTWLLPVYGQGFSYSGFIQVRDRKTGEVFLLELREGELDRQRAEKVPLDYKHWIGALYYEIITVKAKPKPYYTLLGWRGAARHSTMKVIDVLSVEKGNAVFGMPVFKTENGQRHRILFEYNPQAVMTLQYDPRKKLIVFDHLSPPDTAMAGVYAAYGPDFTYDAFRLRGKQWKLILNYEARNKTGGKTNPDAGEFRNKQFYKPVQE